MTLPQTAPGSGRIEDDLRFERPTPGRPIDHQHRAAFTGSCREPPRIPFPNGPPRPQENHRYGVDQRRDHFRPFSSPDPGHDEDTTQIHPEVRRRGPADRSRTDDGGPCALPGGGGDQGQGERCAPADPEGGTRCEATVREEGVEGFGDRQGALVREDGGLDEGAKLLYRRHSASIEQMYDPRKRVGYPSAAPSVAKVGTSTPGR